MSPKAISMNKGTSMSDKKLFSSLVQFYIKLPEEIIEKAIEKLSRKDRRDAQSKKKLNEKIVAALTSTSASTFADEIYQCLSSSMFFSTDVEYEDIINSYNDENCIMNTVLVLKKCYDGSYGQKIMADFIKSEQFIKTIEDAHDSTDENKSSADVPEEEQLTFEMPEVPEEAKVTTEEETATPQKVIKVPEVNEIPEKVNVVPEETILQIPETSVEKATEKPAEKVPEKSEPVSAKKKVKDKITNYYIGHIEKRETYYNFAPQYRIEDNGSSKKLIELRQVSEKFPPNGTINLSYFRSLNSQSQKIVEGLDLQYTFAISFTDDILEENINYLTGLKHSDVNLKIDLQKEFDKNRNSTKFFRKISELRIFRIVEPEEYITDSQLLSGIIEINSDFAKDELVLLRRRNDGTANAGSDDISGPYKVYKKNEKTYIQPKIADERYLLNCHREEKLTFGISERQEFDCDPVCIPFAMISDGSTYKKDIISDEILLKSMLTESSKDFFNIIKKKPEEFIQMLGRSPFLSGNLPEEVKFSRLARIHGLFKNIQKYTDEQRQIAMTFVDAYNTDSQVQEALSGMVTASQEYKDLQKELEKKSKAVQTAKSEAQLAAEAAKAMKISEKNGEVEVLEQKIEKLKEEYNVLSSYGDILKDIEYQERIKAYLLEENARLQHKNSEMKGKIKTTIAEQANEVNIAFDPYVSNAMLEAASEWHKKQESEIYSKAADIIIQKSKDCNRMESKELCEYLVNYVKRYRNYSTNDILNMYICITQGFLTVFAGLPGTGKTSVCNIIGNSLGLTNFGGGEVSYDRFVPISVEKGWSSKKDLIGYYNPLTKKYDKTNRRLYDSLMILNEEREKSKFPYMVLLDEANLSPMEYYWADFMQLADRSEESDIYINIGLEHDIYIPDTLRFVATINNDQTTETLSPRLLDRAWIIKLPDSDINARIPVPEKNILWEDLKKAFTFRTEETMYTLPVLENISKLFHSYGMTVSPRIKLSMYNYIASAREVMHGIGGVTSEYIAADYAVMQKLLPKINCRLKLYEKFFNEFIRICNNHHLDMTKNAIEEMMKNAERNMGYCQYLS
ncbi:MAG: hypothetical protein K2K89_12440 [Ruminococcus sp.]|nr:hypothetical protein [Ruminococcus sp.]